jgi:hypothetical protein
LRIPKLIITTITGFFSAIIKPDLRALITAFFTEHFGVPSFGNFGHFWTAMISVYPFMD